MAQSPIYVHFGVNEGLPSPTVHRVFQDQMGYLWFATEQGIARYDGHSMKVYGVEEGLCENETFGFFEDHEHRIWIHGLSGCLTYVENGRLHAPSFNQELKAHVQGEALQSLAVDSVGTVWLTMKFRPDVLSIDTTGTIVIHSYEDAQTRFQVKRIGLKNLVFGNGQRTKLPIGQQRADITLLGVNSVSIALMPAARDALEVSPSALVISDSSFAFAANSFLSVIGDSSQKYGVQLPAVSTNSLFFDSKKRIWIGTSGAGVVCYSDQTLKAQQFHFFDGHTISSICEDHEGGFWFSSLDVGVFYVRSVDFLKADLKKEEGFDEVIDITGDKEKVYIAKRSGDVSLFTINEEHTITHQKTWSYNKINDIVFAGGCLHIAQQFKRKGLITDRENGHYLFSARKVYPMPKSSEIYTSGGRTFWKFSNEQLVLQSPTDLGFESRVYAFHSDKKNGLWLGCLDGLYFYANDKVTSWRHRNLRFTSTISSFDAHDDLFVIGFKEHGLMVVHGTDTLLINKQNGLVSEYCNDVVIDSFAIEKTIYVATNRGYSKISLGSETLELTGIENVEMEDGLGVNLIHNMYLSKDHVWLATHLGAIYCLKSATVFNDVPPHALIGGVSVNGIEREGMQYLALPHDSNDIEFEVSGLSFKTTGNGKFHYRLRGADEQWKSTSGPLIRYTQLPPGDYRFELKAENNSGILSQKAAFLSFEIKPAIWNTWWFRLAYWSVAIVLLICIVQFRISQIRNRARLQEALNRSRQQALNAQMNPHFIFNSLHSIQQFIMRNDKRSSNRYLTKFASLMRESLRQSDLILVKLDKDIRLLELYLELEALRFEGKFDYRINVNSAIQSHSVFIPPFLIQPYVENAIWHGLIPARSGTLRIDIDQDGDRIKIEILDNGIGIRASKLSKSQNGNYRASVGMDLSRKRMQLLEEKYRKRIRLSVEDIADTDPKMHGTRITIELPLIMDESEFHQIIAS